MLIESAFKGLGLPNAIRVDQSSEFVLRGLDLWNYQHGITPDSGRPGKPLSLLTFSRFLMVETINLL